MKNGPGNGPGKGDASASVLAKVKGYFEQAAGSGAYRRWQKEARESWAFYDGEQWTADEKAALAQHGQPAIVINKIAARIDNLAGVEVAGRTRVVYRSRSGIPEEEAGARIISDLALYVAERSSQALEVSNLFRSGLVGGIGWLDVGVEDSPEGPFVFSRCEDPFSVIWDVASKRADMGDMRFVCRERWLNRDEVEGLFPGKGGVVAEGLGAMASGWLRGGRAELDVAYWDARRDVARVVEVQYKEPATCWRLRLPDGRLMATFDPEARERFPEAVVEETNTVPQVRVAYFCGDALLDDRPLAYEHNQFTLIPFVYKRHMADGRPYGLVRGALDPQRELNKRRSKAMHLLNTAQVIADIDAVEDPATLAREAARPDGMILKRAGKDLRIIRNTDLASSQVSVMEQAGHDIQDVMGVYDESLGRASNAVSGVAIQQRQVAGSMNQMFTYDSLRLAKKRLGEQVLGLIRQFFTTEMVIRITDQMGAPRSLFLNTPVRDAQGNVMKDAHGEIVRVNDVRVGSFDVVVEEVKDVVSSRELELQQLQMLMAAGVPVPPSLLVEASDVRNKEAILAVLPGASGRPPKA